MGVPSQPIAVDGDDDGLTDLILAPEGRFFRRHGTGETEKDWAIGGPENRFGLVFLCSCKGQVVQNVESVVGQQ